MLEPRILLAATPVGPEFRVNTVTANNQSSPSVAMDADGNYVVTWHSYGQDGNSWGIYAQRHDAAGTKLGSEFRVNTQTASSQSLVSIAMDADGDFLITWTSYGGQDGNGPGVYAQRYASNGTALGSEFRVNTNTTGNQKRSRVAMDADGDFVVVWEDASGLGDNGYGVYAQRYAANGVALGSEFRVNTHTTGAQSSPDIAMNADGSFVIAWQSSGQDGDGTSIHAQRYSAAGAALGSEFQVNTYTTSFQAGPRVAMDAAGNFVVIWNSQNQDGGGNGIYAQLYASNGTSRGIEFLVNTFTAGSQQNPSVTMSADGSFVVTWESAGQDGGGIGIYAQQYSADGSADGIEVRVNSHTTGNQQGPALASSAGGSFVVAWYGAGQGDGDGIFAQRFAPEVNSPPTGIVLSSSTVVQQQPAGLLVGTFTASDPDSNETFTYALVAGAGDDDNSLFDVVGNQLFTDHVFDSGAQPTASIRVRVTDHGGLTFDQTFVISVISEGPVGGEFRVNTVTSGDQSAPRVAMDADGDVVVTWTAAGQDGNGLGVYAQRYNAQGAAVGGEFRVNTRTLGNQFDSRVAMDAAGNFIITWTSSGQDGSGYGVYAQRYSASGATVGGEFRVNTTTMGSQYDSSVAMDDDGNFVVSWTSYSGQDGDVSGVYAQRYTSAGAASGGEFRVNTWTESYQENSSVAMDHAGNFVIVWESSWQDGGMTGVYGQRFAANGNALGGEFRVNAYTSEDQYEASVAMDASGNFVVTWTSWGQDGDSFGIYAQQYNSSGSTVGGEFRVNTHTAMQQSASQVAMDSDGNFLVAWRSYLQDGSGDGVYAKRYNALGTVLDPEFRVNTFSTGTQDAPAVAMNAQGKFIVTWQSAAQDGSGQGIFAQRYIDLGSAPTDIALSTNLVVQQRPGGTWIGMLSAVDADPDETFMYALVSGAGEADNARFDIVDGALFTAAVFDVDSQTTASIRVRVTDSKGLTFEKVISLSIVRGGAVGNEFLVNTRTTNKQDDAAVAMDARGDFVVTWSSYGQDGSGYGVYAQRYRVNGTSVGSEFRVNSAISSEQMYSDVAIAPDGRFVVTFSSFGSDGSGWGVYGRMFNADGTAVAAQFRINSHTTNWQNFSSVAMDASGNFVVAWQSLGQDGDDYGIYAQRYLANGTAVGSEFRVNTHTTSWQRLPSVAMDADGDFVIAWQSFDQDGQLDGIYAQRFAANGVPQGSEFRVNVTTQLSQSSPKVAMDDDGDFVIAWTGDNLGGGSYEAYARRYAADGTALTSEFRVNTWTTGSQGVTALAMDGEGNFVISWTSNGQDGSGNGVYAQRFLADGTLDGGEYRVNTFTTGSQSQGVVALGAGGLTVIAWTSAAQDGSNDGVYAQRILPGGPLTGFALHSSSIEENAPAGTPVGTLLPFDADPAAQFTYSLVDGNGSQSNSHFTIVNGELRTAATLDFEAAATHSVRVRATHASGYLLERVLTIDVINLNDAPTVHLVKLATTLPWSTTVTQRTKVADVVIRDDILGTNLLSLAGTHADAFELIDTELFLKAGVNVDFYTTPALEVAVRVNDPALGGTFEDEAILSIRPPLAATRSGGEFQVNVTGSGNQDDPRIAMDADGNYVVTWMSNYEIYARKYSSNGTPLSVAFQVNNETAYVQKHPDVAMDAAGNFVVTWSGFGQDTSGGVYAWRYAADGTEIGEEFRVNSYRTGNQQFAHVAMNATGDFVVIWHDDERDGFEGVYAQRYSADGTAQGAEFRVNQSAGAGAAFDPNSHVAIDADGNFIVTWASDTGGTGSWDIFARWFAPDGSPHGDEFRVNSHTAGSQTDASAVMDADGNFVITWASAGSEGGRFDIYARRYSLNGIPLGDEFRVSTSTVLDHVDPNVTMSSDGSFVIAWEGTTFFDHRYRLGDEGIYAQRFAADGARLGGEFRVNTNTTAVPYNASDLAVDADGNFVVVWSSWYQDGNQGGIYAQHFDAGQTATSPTRIALSANRVTEQQPAGMWVAALSAKDGDPLDAFDYELVPGAGDNDNAKFTIENGQLYTAATFELASQSTAAIRIRVTDSYGLSYEQSLTLEVVTAGPVGNEFRVSPASEDERRDPRVGIDADGNFVVTWEADELDGSQYGIYAQRYSADGVALGDAFRVNTYTTGNQVDPYIAVEEDGEFTISWISYDQDHAGQFAQRFGADGAPLGSESQVFGVDDDAVAFDAAGNYVRVYSALDDGGFFLDVFASLYAADGTLLSEFQVNSYTTQDQWLPSVAMDASGNFVITWTSEGQDGWGDGVFARRFSAQGTPLGAEFRVNTYIIGDQWRSSVTMDTAGHFVVIWESEDQDGDGWGLYGQHYGADGTPLGAEFRINVQTTRSQINASVAMNDDGDLVVAWMDMRSAYDGYDLIGSNGIFARRFTRGESQPPTSLTLSSTKLLQRQPSGMGIGTFSVNDADSFWDAFTYTLVEGVGDDDNVRFAISGNRLVTADTFELAEQATAKIRIRVTDHYGHEFEQQFVLNVLTAGLAGEFRVNTTTADDQTLPSVAMNADGDFVVAWQSYQEASSFFGYDGWGIYAQRYNAAGQAVGSQLHVNSYTTASQLDPQVAMDADGDFVVTWHSGGQDGSGFGVFAQRYNSNGTKQGGEFRVNSTITGNQTYPRIAMVSDGAFVIAWMSNSDGSGYGIYAQRYNAAGAAVGGEFRVNSHTTGHQLFPTVALDEQHGIVIVWESIGQDGDGSGIYAQRYDAAGAAVGSEFRINTFTASDQRNSTVTMDADGDFLIAWESLGQDGDGFGIFAQRFSSDGAAQGAEFRVNTNTADRQRHPVAAMSPSGDFVIAWQSADQDGDGYGVYAQRYSADGSRLGDEFLINLFSTNSQDRPSIAIDAGGNFIVGWSSWAQDGSLEGVYARRYLAGATPSDISLSNAEISENVPVGTVVGTFTGADADIGERLTYTLVAGPGDTNNALFVIHGDQLRTAAEIDFESTPNPSIRVRVTDSAGYVFEKTLSIDVADINEPPTVALAGVVTSLAENTPTTTRIKVADIVLTDDSPGPHNVLSLIGEDADLFEIDGTGLFLRAGVRINFERNAQLDVGVRVDDAALGDSFEDEALLSISVTDVVELPPVIGGFAGTAAYFENAVPVLIAPSVTVTDPDSPNFETGTLVASIVTNRSADDRLSIRHQGNAANQIGVDLANRRILLGGVQIGTFEGGDDVDPLVVTFNANATAAAVRALIQNLTFANISDTPSTLARQVRLVLTGDDGMVSQPVVKTVTVSAVNDAPVIAQFDGSVTWTEAGGPILIDHDATVADVDSNNFSGGRLTVTLTANGHANDRLAVRHEGTGIGQIGRNGTSVTFGGVVIGTVSGGTGTAALVVTLSANANTESVAALLRNITFNNVSNAPTLGNRTLSVTLSDGDGGTSLARTKSVTITPVNNPPSVAAFESPAVTYIKNAAPLVLDADVTVADPDSANFGGGNVTMAIIENAEATDILSIRHQGNSSGQIGVNFNTSEVRFGSVLIGTFTGGAGANPLVVSLNASATRAAVQALLRNLTFRSTAVHPSTLARRVELTVNDGDDSSSPPLSKVVNVQLVRPTVDAFDTTVTYTENAAPLIVDSNATVTDAGSRNFDGGRLEARVIQNASGDDRLGILHQGNSAGQIGVAGNEIRFGNVLIGTSTGGEGSLPLVVELNANATPAAVQALLRRLAFSNVSDAPSTATRRVEVTVTDDDGQTSTADSKQVNVKAVNDAPVITGFDGTTTFTEAAGPVLLDEDATLTDVDSANFNTGRLTATLTAGGNASDRLGIRSIGDGPGQVRTNGTSVFFEGIQIGTFSGGTGTAALIVVLNADARPEGVEALLRSLTFNNVSTNPTLANRTVSVTLTDGDGGTSLARKRTVTVTAVNTPPTVAAFDTPVNYVRNGAAVLLDTNVTFTDPDSTNFGGGTVTVAVTANVEPDDRLGVRHQGNASGQIGVNLSTREVRFGNVLIGTLDGGEGANPLVITLTTAATPAAVQALLRNLTFSSATSTPSLLPRTVTVTVDDGDGGSSASPPESKTVNVVSNTVIGGWDTAVTYTENAANTPVVLDTSVTLTDADSPHFGGGTLQFIITNATEDDRLAIRHQGNAAGQIGVDRNTGEVFFAGTLIGTFTGGDGLDPLTVNLNSSATLAAVRALIQNATYANVSDNPSTLSRRIAVTLTDADGYTSPAVSKQVSVKATNDAPAIGQWVDPATYQAGGPAVVVDNDATLTDPDSFNFHSGRLTIQLVSNAQSADRLGIRNEGILDGQIGTNGTSVTFGGTTIGTFSGGSGATALTIVFNQNATRDAIEALLRNLTFSSTSLTPSLLPRTIRATLTDGDGGTSPAQNKTVNVQNA